jgi:single-strand DNA-binding protein
MSLRGHKSRQIGPSFLRRRRTPPAYVQRQYVRSPFRSLEQPAMRWFRSQQRRFCKPGIPRSMQIMKRSSLGFLPCMSGHTLRATSGARRHVAALLSGLLSQSKFGSLLQNARLGTWEPGLSLWLRRRVTRPIREFNFGDFTMYQNRITLIGFLGNDAITRTANNASFTVLSLATKSSYKDKKTGEYNSHTEWHRCVVWGRLAEYAKTLTKGAHLSVEGELRSREQTNKKTNAKQRVWEVRVSSILKLDRAEKVSPEDQEPEEINQEEEAA